MENNQEKNDSPIMSDIYGKQEKYIGKRKSGIIPVIAGLLILLPGLFGFLVGSGFFSTEFPLFQVIGAAQLLFATAMIIGGVFAILRKRHKIAMLGALLSVLIYIVPGIIALFLLFMSEDEFES